MLTLIRIIGLWFLCFWYNLMAIYLLLILYITEFPSRPWRPKDHSDVPKMLLDHKLGVHKYAEVNGVRLHYVEAGDRTKPLMLFVHGFPEFWFSWRHQIPQFSNDFWTVAIDLRGFGLSDRPRGISNYKLSNMVEDLRAFLEHLDRMHCILICHDIGATVGWGFVSKYRSMVAKYIFMGSPSLEVYSQLFRSSFDQFPRSWFIVFFQMPFIPEIFMSRGDFASFSVIWNTQVSHNFIEEYQEAYRHVFSQPGALTNAINFYRANFGSLVFPDSKETINIDGSDGLFMLGTSDRFNCVETLTLTKEKYPKIRIKTIPNASHFLHQDDPKTTNYIIREFIGPTSNYCVKTFTHT